MSTVMLLEPARRDRALDEAAARNVAIVMSLRDSGSWAVRKSRFLGLTPQRDSLIVEYPTASDPESRELNVGVGENVGVAFRRGHKKCVFTSVVLARNSYALNDQASVECLVLSWPEQVQELQRRAYYRVAVPRHKTVEVEVWAGGAAYRKKAGTRSWPSFFGRLADISAGGARMLFPKTQDPQMQIQDAAGIQFQPESNGPVFVLDSIIRYVGETPDGSVSVGLQFVGLEASFEGRRVLQQLLRVINQYQRCELRHARASDELDI